MKRPLRIQTLRLPAVFGLLTALLLSACAPASLGATSTPSLPAGTTAPAADETPTLTPTAQPTLGVDPASLRGISLQVWHAFGGETAQLFDEHVALFNAYNEWGLTVTPTGYGDYLTLAKAMQSAIETGQTPHLVIALPEQALGWQSLGLTVDLAPYRRDPVYGLEAGAAEDFPAAFWTETGFPAQRSARYLFYNQTWARELGFSNPPQTPDEFRQQACAANAAFRADSNPQNDGYGGWIVDTHWQTTYSWLLAFGGEVSDGSAYTFRTDPNLAALEFIKGLYDDACAWLNTADSPYPAFAERKALFVSGDLGEAPLAALAMQNAASSDEWTLIPFPGVEKSVLVPYGPDYTILRSGEGEQLAAWLFIRWMAAPERQARWVETTGLLPLRAAALDLIGPYRTAFPQWEAAVSALPLAERTPQLASWGRVRYLLEDGLNYIFLVNLPRQDLPSVLEEIQSMADELSAQP